MSVVLAGAEPFTFDAGPSAPAGVLLCHGFTGTPQSLRPWGEHLRAAGLSVVCPLLPGHGTRWQDMNATGWHDWYGALDRALDELRALVGPDVPIVAAGLSMGGTLVTRLAQRRGAELAGLVLVNPSYSTLRKDGIAPLLSKFVGSTAGIGNDVKKPGVTELAYTRTPLKAYVELTKLWADVRAGLASVTVPIRVYQSDLDHVVERESCEILVAGATATTVEMVGLPDSYHVATLDNDAQVIFDGTLEFVRKVTS